MAQTKTKPQAKAAAPAKAAAKGAKPKATKANEAAAKPKAPSVIFEEGQLVKFTGYRSNVSKDEAVFKAEDVLYIVSVEQSDEKGVLYTAIKASDIEEYETNGDDNVTGGEVAPTEVSELKGSALDKARDQFIPVVKIGRLAEMLEANDDVVEVALDLNREIQANFFWLGGALALTLQKGAHLKANGGNYAGEEAFHDFCNAEFGFSGSKGRALARIYTTFSGLENFDPDSLAGIDWSKVSIAERFVTPENVNEVLEIAEGTTQRELAVTLKQKFASDGKTASGKAASRGAGSTLSKKTLTFKLDEDSADTVELVLTQGMKQTGLESPAAMLERICIEWAEANVDGDAAKKRIQNKAKQAAKAREAAAPAPKEATPAKAAPKPAPKKK